MWWRRRLGVFGGNSGGVRKSESPKVRKSESPKVRKAIAFRIKPQRGGSPGAMIFNLIFYKRETPLESGKQTIASSGGAACL